MRRVDIDLPVSVSQGRVKTSIRVDEYTWTRFQARVKELGLSTCFVLEQLMRMWTFGGADQVPAMAARELHLHVQYGVTRPRRYPREVGYNVEVTEKGSLESCFECGRPPRFVETHRLDLSHVLQIYACQRHHELHKRMGVIEGWREL